MPTAVQKVRQFEVVPVGRAELPVIWQQGAAWLDATLKEYPTLITLEQMKAHIESSRWLLWAVRFGWELQALCVTEIVQGPNAKALYVVAMGGRAMEYWIEAWSERMEQHARDAHCTLIAELGRPGWARVLRPLGWIDGPLMMMRKVGG